MHTCSSTCRHDIQTSSHPPADTQRRNHYICFVFAPLSRLQVIKYVDARSVMNMLTRLENTVLHRKFTDVFDSDSDSDSDSFDGMIIVPAPQFSSPRRRVHRSKIRDSSYAPRVKKPRRRVRKENKGYDLSPTTSRNESSS